MPFFVMRIPVVFGKGAADDSRKAFCIASETNAHLRKTGNERLWCPYAGHDRQCLPKPVEVCVNG